MRFSPFLLAILVIAMSACKTEAPEAPPAGSSDSYLPLQVGNMWIYEFSLFTSDGSLISNRLDSSYVSKDSVIAGETYYKLINQFIIGVGLDPSVWIREDMGTLRDPDGRIFFSESMIGLPLRTDSFELDLYGLYQSDGFQSTVNTPSGDYTGYRVLGNLLSATDPDFQREHPSWFVEGIGIVREEIPFALSDTVIIERSLLDFVLVD